MPRQSAYDAARQRIAARRAAKPTRSATSRFGSALRESAVNTAGGLAKMFMASRGNVPAAMEMGEGLLGTIEEFKGAGPGTRAAIAAETLTGIPVRGIGQKIKEGDYAGAAGESVIPVGLGALGLKGMRSKPRPQPQPKLLPRKAGPNAYPGARFVSGPRGMVDKLSSDIIDVTPVNAVDGPATVLPGEAAMMSRVSPEVRANYSGMGEPIPLDRAQPVRPRALLPQRATQPPRFVAGERGIVDATGPQLIDVNPVNPRLGRREQGTVLPGEVNQLNPVDPITRATYSGTGMPARSRNLPSSAGIDPFSGSSARAFEALVPERYKTTPNIQPFEGVPIESPRPSFYPPTDPGVVNPLDSRISGLPPETTPKIPRAPKGKTKKEAPKKSRLEKNFPKNKAVEETQKQASQARPYQQVRDVDLETLANKLGDKQAIRELAIRRQKPGRLSNERGEIDITAGVEKAKRQLKNLGRKVGPVVADAQRAAMLTGLAVPKSALGAVGGLASELTERALTQSPRRTASDVAKVVKSLPRGAQRSKRAFLGQEDTAEAGRHLAPPGVLSRPAIRAMAMIDAPVREALESLGLTEHQALQRILNAKPSSKLGKDLIAFLSKHPFIKNVVSPVGSVTSTNIFEQGFLRTPGVNMTKRVKRMEPQATTKKQLARGAAGAGAAYAGYEAGEELGEDNYILKGLLTAMAGPYALPVGLGIAFSSEEDLGRAIDNLARDVGREAPIRMPTAKISTELERRFTPAVIRQMREEPPAGSRNRRRRPGRRRPRR